MKKFIYTLALALILNSAFLFQICFSQWQPDVRLTNDTANSNPSFSSASIASSGSVVHVVWRDNRDGNTEIYYKRSTNEGVNWGTDIRLTNNAAESWSPSVAVSGSVVHITWQDVRNGNYEIYYKRSTDAGVTWGADTRLTNNSYYSVAPFVAVLGSAVHIAWMDNRDGNNHSIYYKRSTDAGLSWGADTRLTNTPFYAAIPHIALSGLDVHIVWVDRRDNNYEEIYYKRSPDGGINWTPDTRLTYSTFFGVSNPSVAVSGQIVHIVWSDPRDNRAEIYYKRSTNAGLIWTADTSLTNMFFSREPSISVSGSVVHLAWYKESSSYGKIYYKKSINAGLNWGGDTLVPNSTGSSEYPSVAVSGPVVHIVWQDNRDGNNEIYYKRNPTGNVGIQNISTEIPSAYSLSQNYPNPFNPITNVKFSILNSGDVKLVVYDVMGREVQTLVNERLNAGTYETTFDGSLLPSGVYFYKLSVGDYSETKKLTLIK